MHFTLGDLIADITQNAAESGARQVELDVRETAGGTEEFRFTVKDNGRGMDKAALERAVDPFVTDGVKHPGRKVGLGIPFLIQTALQSGGGWDIKSDQGQGTTVSAWFDLANVDTPPLGDIPGLFRTALLFSGPDEIIIRRLLERGGKKREYEIKKTELTEALGGLEDAASLILLGKYLHSFEEEEL
ncbi:MAG: ATP-binding protein [Treponema sp.]|nr:ATP-binding protein [Treponema sp.]